MASLDAARFRPVKALRALLALMRNPDDTAQVFKIISAISGGARARLIERLRETPVGERVLREHSSLLPLLSDRARLSALPRGSLGREYVEFCERHGITAEGLIAASEAGDGDEGASADEQTIRARMRDAHDLWHVVTGYQTDVVGEAGVLAFTFAQTRNPALLLIVASAFVRAQGDKGATRLLLLEAFLRGLSAEWLPAADWEALLQRPLEEVRRELAVGPPPQYKPVWSHELPPREEAKAA